jgi:hypothetical protein
MRSSSAVAVTVAAALTNDDGRPTNIVRSRHHEDRRANLVFLTFLLFHIIVWTVYAAMAVGADSIHHDMAEAWVWGQQFQLGYYKHPPFFGLDRKRLVPHLAADELEFLPFVGCQRRDRTSGGLVSGRSLPFRFGPLGGSFASVLDALL